MSTNARLRSNPCLNSNPSLNANPCLKPDPCLNSNPYLNSTPCLNSNPGSKSNPCLNSNKLVGFGISWIRMLCDGFRRWRASKHYGCASVVPRFSDIVPW